MRMSPNITSILLIYTGGTIGMIENPETGALENFNLEQLKKHVPELQNFTFHIDTYQFDPPMDFRIWTRKPGANWCISLVTITTDTQVL